MVHGLRSEMSKILVNRSSARLPPTGQKSVTLGTDKEEGMCYSWLRSPEVLL